MPRRCFKILVSAMDLGRNHIETGLTYLPDLDHGTWESGPYVLHGGDDYGYDGAHVGEHPAHSVILHRKTERRCQPFIN